MKLIIKTVPQGKQLVIDADEKDTVLEVKKTIQSKEGISIESQTLKWQTTELKDEETLNQHGISANFTLSVYVDKSYYGRDWNGRLGKSLIQKLNSLNMSFPEPLMQENILTQVFDGQKMKKSKAIFISDKLQTGKTTLLVLLALQTLEDGLDINNKIKSLKSQQQQKEQDQSKSIFILSENKDEILELLKKFTDSSDEKLVQESVFVGNLQEFYDETQKNANLFFKNIQFFGVDNIEQMYRNSGDKSQLLSILGMLSYHFQTGGGIDALELPKLGMISSRIMSGLQTVRMVFTDRVFSQDFESLVQFMFKQQNTIVSNIKDVGPDFTFNSIIKSNKDEVILKILIIDFVKQLQIQNPEASFSVKVVFDPNEISTKQIEKFVKENLNDVSIIFNNKDQHTKELVLCQRGKVKSVGNEKNHVLQVNLLNLDNLSSKERYSERLKFIQKILWNNQNDFEKKILQQLNLNLFFTDSKNENLEEFQKVMQNEYHWFNKKSDIFVGQVLESELKNKQNPIYNKFTSYLNFNTSMLKQMMLFQQKSKKDAILSLSNNKDPNVLAEALIGRVMGGGGGVSNDSNKKEYEEKIEATEEFDSQTKQLLRQRLSGLSSTTEGEKVKNYFQIVFSIPWGTYVQDNLKLNEAQEILNSKHYGMEKAKEAILNFLAVLQHIKQQKEKEGQNTNIKEENQKTQPPNVICLVGAPGVGKTSLVEVVADCLHRDCVKVALGGVNNVTYLRGHNYTYVGAKAGAIASAFQRSKSMNPVVLLDEIDKVSGVQGDASGGQVASALLEILDPSQNDKFMDHYLDFPINLSQTLFICTANDLGSIPGPLRDRMKIIQVPSYSRKEKIHIAKNYVIPKVLKTCKLDESYIDFQEEAIDYMIMNFSPQESGIRKLQEMITEIAQKTVNEIIQSQENNVEFKKKIVDVDHITVVFGQPYIEYDIKKLVRKHGAVVGLATSAATGGSVKVFESCMYRGKGQLTITSDVGKILQASIQIGIGWVKSNEKYLMEKFQGKTPVLEENLNKFLDDKVNINFNFSPATPIDGPSAGIALFSALISTIMEMPLSSDIAMTGEITLHGIVTAVGGIKQKCSAAIEKGIKEVILSVQNEKQVMEDLTNEQRSKLKFHFVETLEEVLDIVFLNRENLLQQSQNKQ